MSYILSRFLSDAPALKVCGVTKATHARKLVKLGVHAMGINFWEGSKRHCPVEKASPFLPGLAGKILRVGLFVNAEPDLPRRLMEGGLIDLAQFHGDETVEYCAPFARDGLPFMKAIGVRNEADLDRALDYGADALLLDVHAPGVYGGTGERFDWSLAADFVRAHPKERVVLAGGITVDNIREALATVKPVAVDVASGAEKSPGVKDFDKIAALQAAVQEVVTALAQARRENSGG